MYAVFQSGGKQHLAKLHEIIRLEKLEIPIGNIIEFKQIILIVHDNNMAIGMPFLKNYIIKAQIINHGRANKIHIIKFRRRKHFRKHQGHRQWFTDVEIIEFKSNIIR